MATAAVSELPEGGASTVVQNATWHGTLHDNVSNAGRSGSGFNPLTLRQFPGCNLYRADFVGLNFEHVFNGAAAYHQKSMFTPRKDKCRLEVHNPQSVSLHWDANDSAWAMDCSMRYTLNGSGIDMLFSATPTQDLFPLGYVAMMWASYMGRTRERQIHFYGTQQGEEKWLSFGEDTAEGFETGTIAFAGVPPLRHEAGAQILNLVEHPTKFFLLPFYYGLVDGDGNLATDEDVLAYIMMFDQAEPIRFALWNFIKDEHDRPDPHSPAWDWQYVIQHPKVGQAYTYCARMQVQPATGVKELREEYERWVKLLRN